MVNFKGNIFNIWKLIIKKMILYIILIYFWFLLFLFFMQKWMLYHPNNISFLDCNTFKEDEQKIYKNTRFYEKKWDKEWIIVFFHWNAWSACNRSVIKWLLEKIWYSIIFVEYTWYTNIGNKKPNIKDILIDVDNIWEYINSKKYKKIYVMWRSLWTWPASYLSSLINVEKLLLISPYSQLYRVAADKYPIFPVKYLFSENYNSEKYLENYKNNLLIIHWKLDKVIPYKFWKELFDWLVTTKKDIISLDNWSHHNIFEYEEVNKKIIEFLK